MKKYKTEVWGFSIWTGDTQTGAAVGCWPWELTEKTWIPVRILRIGTVFTADELT